MLESLDLKMICDITATMLSALANITFGFLVVTRSRSRHVKLAFALMAFGFSTWELAAAWLSAFGLSAAVLRQTYTYSVFWSFGILYLSHYFPDPYKPRRLRYYAVAAPFILMMTLTPLLIPHASGMLNRNPSLQPGPLLPVVGSFFLIALVQSIYNFRQQYIHASPAGRQKIKYFMVTLGLSFAWIVLVDLIINNVFNDWRLAFSGPISMTITLGVATYAILKYRMFDIDLVVKKSTYFLLLFLAVTLPYLVLSHLITARFPAAGVAHIAFSALFWMLFILFIDGIKQILLSLTDKIFFMADYDYDKTLNAISRSLQGVTDFTGLIKALDHGLRPSLKMIHCGLILIDPRTDTLQYYALQSSAPQLPAHQGLMDMVAASDKNTLFYDEITARFRTQKQPQDKAILDVMDALQARLLVAALHQEQMTVVIALGHKKSGENYKEKDINLLFTLASQISLIVARLHEIEEKSRIRMEKELQEKYAAQLEASNALLQSKNDQLAATYDQIKKQEAALISQEKLAILGDITASVAHEISTPLLSLTLGLNKLITYTTHLRKIFELPSAEIDIKSNPVFQGSHEGFDNTSTRLEQALEQIRHQVNTMKSFIKFQKTSDTFNLNDEIITTLQIMNYKLLSEMSITKTLDPTLPDLKGDGAALNQALMALFKNAADFRKPDQRGHLWIKTYRQNESVYLEIRDDGRGIDPHHQAKLFHEKFSTKPGGTGLGLTVCQEIISAMNGSIMIESSPGIGTTARIIFPVIPEKNI